MVVLVAGEISGNLQRYVPITKVITGPRHQYRIVDAERADRFACGTYLDDFASLRDDALAVQQNGAAGQEDAGCLAVIQLDFLP